MQFIQPAPFAEAVQKLDQRTIVTSTLDSDSWSRVPLALRERAFFSSRVESARFLQRGRNSLADFLQSARSPLPTPGGEGQGEGASILKTGSRADFVKNLQDFAIAEGLGPLDPKDENTIKDIRSERRLGLIFDVQTREANDFGYWQQGQNPDVLNFFPAQRFIRERPAKEPRDLHQLHEGEVRLKSDLDFWIALNQDFGRPWGPWGWGCGHTVEDVDRDHAERLGLIKKTEKAKPVEKEFNDKLRASVENIDPDLRTQLKDSFGDQVEITDHSARWVDDPAPTPAPAPSPSESGSPRPAPRGEGRGEGNIGEGHLEDRADPTPRVIAVTTRVQQRITDLERESKIISGRANALPRESTEHRHLQLKHLALLARAARLGAKLAPTIIRMIEKKQPGRFAPSVPPRLLPKAAPEITFINKLTGPALELPSDVTIRVDSRVRRGYYRPAGREIVVATQARPGLISHELGHALEHHHPDVLERSRKFIAERIAMGRAKALTAAIARGASPEELEAIELRYTPRPLSLITGIRGYKSDELAIEDDFPDWTVYSGKVYPENMNATEVMSKGLENLYLDPVKFLREDPDYFRFVVRTLRGLDHQVEL